MSKVIDQRVVEMKFDNQQFESNIKTSIGSLDRFKQSLKFDGIKSGFADVSKAAGGVKFDVLGEGIATVSSKFSALETIAVGALLRIGEMAVNTGKQLINSLSLEQIKAGFGEYELKMGSVQTIMASTGENIETVSKYLEELNLYADRTIYSFSDMTSSIGKFTNAGVKLDDAVKAIQGISNEAAVSGANANEASRAMYNFAQALSAGYVKLIDWKSIENANMATVEFKQSLIDTALAMGTIVKEGDKYKTTTTDLNGKVSDLFDATSMFNDSLAHQWMTTDVLVQTLGNYSTDVREMSAEEKKAYEEKLRSIGYTEKQIKSIEELGKKAFDSAQDVKTFSQLLDTLREAVGSGWSQTFEILFGNLEEAKTLWTGVNKVVGGFLDNMSKTRNELLQTWKDLGGREDLIQGFKNLFNYFVEIAKPISRAFQNIFPPTTADALLKLTTNFRAFTSQLSLSAEAASKIHRTFRGVFSILDIGKNLIVSFIRAFAPSSSEIGKFVNNILDGTASIGDWIYNLDLAIKKNDSFFKFFSKVKDFLEPIFKSISGFAQGIGGVLSSAGDGIKKFIDSVKEGTNISFNLSGFDSFKTLLENIGNTASKVFSSIFTAISNAFRRVSSFFGSMIPGLKQVSNTLSSIFKTISNSVKNGISSEDINKVSKLISTGLLVGISLSVTNALNQLQGAFKSFNSGISGIFKGITDNFGKFSVDLKTDFGQIAPVLTQLKDTLKAYQTELNAKALKEIAAAIAILAASLFVINLIDPNRLAQSTTALAALFAQLLTSFKVLAVISAGSKGALQLSAITSSMIKMSAALLVMAAALKTIGNLDAEQLRNGFLAISGLMWEMVGVTTVLSGMDKKLKAGTAGMISFAIALRIIAGAIKTLGDMNQDQLVNGLLTLGLTMGAMVIAFNSFNAKHAVSIGAGMLLMATAMTIMGGALKIMGSLNLEQLVTALAALAGTMFILVSTFNSLGKANMLVTAVSMTVLAGALVVLGGALKIMGSLNLEQLVTALAALAGTMFILVSAFNSLGKANMLVTASSMLILSNALVVMGGAIKLLGSLNFEQLLIALAALAGSMLILGAAFKLLGSANMLVTAGAMTIMAYALNSLAIALKMLGSLNLAQLGVALGALAGTFIILGVAASVLAPLIPAILGLAGALALIGASVALAGVGIAFFASGLGTLVAVGLSGLKEFMDIVKSSMKETLILLGAGIVSLAAIFAVLGVGASVLTPLIPSIIGLAAAFALLGVGVAAIGYGADHLSMAFERLAKVGPNGMKAVVEMIKILGESIDTIVEMAVNGIVGFIKMMADKTPELLGSFAKIIEALLAYFVRVAPEVAESGLMLITALLTSIRNHIGDIVTLGIEIVVNYINAIKSKIGDLIQAGIDLAISFINGLASGIDNNSDRFINAIDHLISSVLSLLVKAALKFVDRGADFITKLLSGINKMQGEILKKIVDLAAQFLEKIGVKSKWVQKGRDFIQGLIDGFVEMRDQAVKLIKSIGKNIIGGITGVFDEHSPSKEAHKIGAFFMRGMDNGFIEYGKRVQGSAVRISEDILDAFKTTMSAVSDYISSDYEPTITPVMDLSNVTAGAGDINKLFENTKTQELAWQASANGNFNVMTDLTKQLNSKFDSFSNDDVVSEIAGLRSDMAAMNERLGRMQVVMDTGTLVGALGPGMDNYLGNMSVLAGRGV